MQSMHLEQTTIKVISTIIVSFLQLLTPALLSADNLTLQQAEQIALSEEPGLISQIWTVRSLQEKAIATGQLKDPKIQIALANLAADSFDFGQEPMTQFKIAYLQQFPPGKTLDLKQQKIHKKSQLTQSKMAERNLVILKNVRLIYLEIYYWEQAKQTLIRNKQLFAQLVDIVQSLFSVGRNDQQDLIRAQLGLSKLDDRLTLIEQKILTQRSRLSRWLGTENSLQTLDPEIPELPAIKLINNINSLTEHFLVHPEIQQLDKQIEINRNDSQLVKESLKPGWALNVSYGYRDEDPMGRDRADFVSAAVTFDLPLFSANRQDRERLAKEHEYQSLKSKRTELLRKLIADLQQQMASESQFEKRQQLYSNLLLPQSKQQAQASLLAYQSDRGSFSDVMRAYMDDLNAKLDAKRITIDRLKAQAEILYFVPSFRQEIHTEFR